MNSVGRFLVAAGFGLFFCGAIVGLVTRWVFRRPYARDRTFHFWLLGIRFVGLAMVLLGALLQIAARL